MKSMVKKYFNSMLDFSKSAGYSGFNRTPGGEMA
jgi:hypothetical protein